MITQMILVIVIGVAVVVAAVAYTNRTRKNKKPIQLGVGRKLRRQEFGNQRRTEWDMPFAFCLEMYRKHSVALSS